MNRNLRLVFMGTPEFAVPTLSALVKAGYNIVAVYTQPPRPAGRGQKETPSPVHQYAIAHSLPVYNPVSLKDSETQRVFREHNADAAIVAAYGLLLPEAVLTATPMGCINIHPSLLPRWRGAAPIQRAIMAGDKETGIVIMQMDKGLDTGDMLMTKHFPIKDGMNAGELHDMLAEASAPMVLETLANFLENKIMPVKQPETGVTYSHKITKEECRINWNEPAEAIRNKILGLAPNPGAFFIYMDEAIKVFDARLAVNNTNYKEATVIDNNLTIACGQGAIGNLVIRRPGKKLMPAVEMLKGYPVIPGTQLE